MRSRLLMVLIAAAIAVIGCDSETDGEPVGPLLRCQQPVVDFGTRNNADEVTVEFTIANVGDAPLEITRMKPGCGCTSASISEKVIEPNDAATVTVRLSLLGRKGKISEHVLLSSNDPTRSQIKLVCRGTVVQRVLVTPTRLRFDSYIVDDEVQSAGILVRAADPTEEFTITAVETDSRFLAASWAAADKSPDGKARAFRISVRTKPPVPLGLFEATVRVLTDSGDFPSIAVPVSGRVIGALGVSPEVIVLSYDGQAGVMAHRIVDVFPGRVKDFKIKSVETPMASVKAEVTTAGKSGYLIRLTNIPVSGEVNGKVLRILTDAKGAELIQIPFKVVDPLHK